MTAFRGGALAAIAFALLASAGCVTTGTANVDSRFDPANRATGLVVLSVTVSTQLPGTHWYQIVGANNPNPISIPTNADNFGLDWNPAVRDGKNFVGRLAVIELAPGTYEVRRWIMRVDNTAQYASRRPIGYRFTVAAGSITYIGNVHTDIQVTASPSSLPYLTQVSDEQERDLPILFRKYTQLKQSDVRIQVTRHEPTRDVTPVSLDSLRDLIRE